MKAQQGTAPGSRGLVTCLHQIHEGKDSKTTHTLRSGEVSLPAQCTVVTQSRLATEAGGRECETAAGEVAKSLQF